MKAVKFLPFVIVIALAACGEKNATKEPAPADKSASASISAPAASVAMPVAAAPAAPAAPAAITASAAPSAADLAKGEKIYTTTCQACHAAAVLGAPKFGDKASWDPRVAKGKDALYTSALNGFKMMPPRGGNAGLKDDEIKAAVDYMVSKGS